MAASTVSIDAANRPKVLAAQAGRLTERSHGGASATLPDRADAGHQLAERLRRLLTACPFRVGERVRLQGGPLAGSVGGVMSSLGLLYTTFSSDEGPVMVPNAVVLGVAVVPLREPQGVELRARLRLDITPADVEDLLRRRITTPLRGNPRVTLEELDGDEVVVRIAAAPQDPADGPRLAGEVPAAIEEQTVRGAAAEAD